MVEVERAVDLNQFLIRRGIENLLCAFCDSIGGSKQNLVHILLHPHFSIFSIQCEFDNRDDWAAGAAASQIQPGAIP